MGITYLRGTVIGTSGSSAVEFLVDSGATYTVLPSDVWPKIGVEKTRDIALRLADGSLISRDVGECRIVLDEARARVL